LYVLIFRKSLASTAACSWKNQAFQETFWTEFSFLSKAVL
jgi:hypothetical protein